MQLKIGTWGKLSPNTKNTDDVNGRFFYLCSPFEHELCNRHGAFFTRLRACGCSSNSIRINSAPFPVFWYAKLV